MTQQASILTWVDVLKLCVPFIFSLFLIWIKLVYENQRERKAKQTFLWRTISSGQTGLPIALSEFDKIAKAAEVGTTRVVAFDVPRKLGDFADRLAELDTKKSHIYSTYSSQAEIVRGGLHNLRDLQAALVSNSDEETRQRIASVIKAQTTSLGRDLVTLARRELEILEVICAQDPAFDKQVVDRQRVSIDEASRAIRA